MRKLICWSWCFLCWLKTSSFRSFQQIWRAKGKGKQQQTFYSIVCPLRMEDAHPPSMEDVATAYCLAELSTRDGGDGSNNAPLPITCRLLADHPSRTDEAPYAWLSERADATAASSSMIRHAVHTPLPMLPSLADLSADHLSIDSAYFAAAAAAAASSRMPPPMPSLQPPIPFLPMVPVSFPYMPTFPFAMQLPPEKYDPLATMTTCGVWYARWTDCASKRGHSAVLSFQWEQQQQQQQQTQSAMSDASLGPLHLAIKLYSHKGLLNRNAHYRRGRFGCVLLSKQHAVVVTAHRAGAHSEMVMIREQQSASEPLWAMALGTCYEIRFFCSLDAAGAISVRHTGTRSETDVAVSSLPIAPPTSSPASATASASPSASSVGATSAASSVVGTPSTITMDSNFGARKRISCAPCRQAKAKCDEQR